MKKIQEFNRVWTHDLAVLVQWSNQLWGSFSISFLQFRHQEIMGSSAVEVLNFFHAYYFMQLHKLPSQHWNSFLISKMFTTHWPDSIEITTSLYLIIAQVHSWVYKKRVWDLWQVQNSSFMSYFLLFFHELLFLNFLTMTCVPDYGNIESWFYFQNIYFFFFFVHVRTRLLAHILMMFLYNKLCMASYRTFYSYSILLTQGNQSCTSETKNYPWGFWNSSLL